jgi:hypothetical protein
MAVAVRTALFHPDENPLIARTPVLAVAAYSLTGEG